MMGRAGTSKALALLIFFAVVSLNAVLFRGALGHWFAGVSGPLVLPLAEKMAWLKGYTLALFDRTDVAEERLRVQQLQRDVDAHIVQVDQLKADVAFYRSAAGFRETFGREPLRGGAFAWPTQGGQRELVINRGSEDGVGVGDAVVTADGELIGMIRDTYTDHAVAVAVGDLGLEVTARIINTDISGLVRSDREGVLLDLVLKSETVTEGQIVVTAGNDHLPPGLIIGTVRAVDHDAATLFVPVRITPAISQPYAGQLLIIRRQ